MSCKSFRLRAVFIVASVLTLSLLFAPSAQAQSVEEIHRQAEKLYKAKKYKQAAPLYLEAAKQGHARAQNGLGWLYEYGKGVKQDYTQASKWYRQSAEQGYARGQRNLGLLYERGKGVEQDYTQAFEWYRKAVEQGRADALANLANLYVKGEGIEQNMPLAYGLYLLAVKAKEGNFDAQNAVKDTKRKLTKEQIKEGEKIAEEWQRRIEANKKK